MNNTALSVRTCPQVKINSGDYVMENQPRPNIPILEIAWRKFAQFDVVAGKRSKAYMQVRRWVALLGVLATLFAILTAIYPKDFSPTGGLVLKILLILSPLLASALAAFVNKFYSSGDWLVMRAGAEEVLKEIYYYRTILQRTATRRDWLAERLQEIQRTAYRSMNGELVMDNYDGPLPPAPRFTNPGSDPGFTDLTGAEYYTYRLKDQLNWHVKKVNQSQRQRISMQLLILVSGMAGAFLAAWGGQATLWVALAASLTTTFIGWQELRNLDLVVRNYSKVRLELSIIADHWESLAPEEQTQSEFYKMVRSTEEFLWIRNVEYIKAMQEALKESSVEEEASLINRVIQEQRDSDRRLRKSIDDAIIEQAGAAMQETDETLRDKFKDALGSLAEEASSELVQAELTSMRDSIQETLNDIAERFGIVSSLREVDEEFSGMEAGRDTPPAVLNALISRYPKTADTNG
jgi:hypothetical protein